MTPETAHARIEELKHSADWGKRWLAGDSNSRERREFDALTSLAAQRGSSGAAAVTASGGDPSADVVKLRIAELKSDPAWVARYLKGGANSPEGQLLDRLSRMVVGAPAPEAKPDPTPEERALAALGRPETPGDYKIDPRDPVSGFPLRMDAETHSLVTDTLLPAAHELDLSQTDVNMITMGIQKPMSEEQCGASLQRIWGKDLDARLDDFRAAVANNPKVRGLLERFPETLGNNPAVIAGIVDGFRRRQARA